MAKNEEKLKSLIENHGTDRTTNSENLLFTELEKQLNKITEFNKTEIDEQRLLLECFDMNCAHCKYQFTSIEEAQYHYHTEHDTAKGFIKCCGIRFSYAPFVRYHLLWHLKPELFRCPLCNIQLYSMLSFKRHANKHAEEGVGDMHRKCAECKKTFRTAHGLKIHRAQKHRVKGTPLF